MADVLDVAQTRIVEILEQNRGALIAGVDADIPLPEGLLRRAPDGISLRDDKFVMKAIDRFYQVEWLGRRHAPTLQNPRDQWQRRMFRWRLDVAYAFGTGSANFVHRQNAEVGSAAAREARKRALSESERVSRALTCAEIFQDAVPGADVTLTACHEDGESTVEIVSSIRLICSTPYVVWLSYRRGTNLAPA